jgi:hypothetical protein
MIEHEIPQTSSRLGILGYAPDTRPGGGAMRAPGSRSFSRRSAGQSPNRTREPSCMRAIVSDGPATYPVGQRKDARCRNGRGIASRERQRHRTMNKIGGLFWTTQKVRCFHFTQNKLHIPD